MFIPTVTLPQTAVWAVIFSSLIKVRALLFHLNCAFNLLLTKTRQNQLGSFVTENLLVGGQQKQNLTTGFLTDVITRFFQRCTQ